MKSVENYRQRQIKNIVKWCFPIALPFVIYWLLFSRIKPEDIFVTIKSISIPWLALGFVMYSANQVFRTMRFQCLTHSIKPDIKQLFRVQSLYIFYNYLLPFRTGEVTYVYLARRHLNIPVANGISSLAVARMLDYSLLIACYVMIAFFMNLSIAPWISILMKGSVACFLVTIVLFLLYLFRTNKFVAWFGKNINIFAPWQKNKIFRKFSGEFQKIVQSFREISNVRTGLQTVFYTLCTWLCIFLAFYMITRGLGFSVSFLHMVIVSVIAVMSRTFQGVADFGSHEIGWFGGLLLIGFSGKDAGIVSFSSHIILLCYMLLVTLYSWATLRKHDMAKQIKFSECETVPYFCGEK
ncbi:MAG: flippase-like domain-containing protein [Candidatus Kuenenia sp.]|nr:flippase-like domain-containing protein [Candidatus Kuenenia hertensis]